ncbi:hypothetical protein QL285_076661 [Trifolium repens]|nr:hypothetical protein QL285_076661 [Trifolium repens]
MKLRPSSMEFCESSENSTVKSTVSAASLFLLHRPQLLTTVMAKKKRFQNPLRSTLQTQAPAQGPTPVAPHQVAHQGPTPVAPTQGPTPVDSSSAHEIPQQTQTSRQYVGRESADSWTVEAIDPQGAIKRIKLKYWQVNDLPIGQRKPRKTCLCVTDFSFGDSWEERRSEPLSDFDPNFMMYSLANGLDNGESRLKQLMKR